MSDSGERDQTLYAWIINLNREPTSQEFAICLRCLDNPGYEKVSRIPRRDDAWRSLLGRLIPQIVMKQRGIPRSNWSIQTTKAGKPYIQESQSEDNKTLGYNISHNGSLVIMAFSLGRKHKVWNIGVDVMRVSMPAGVSLAQYIKSLSHKLTPLEITYLDPELGPEVVLRRLYILWTVKESYIKALGQPPGFDFSRIECRIPDEEVYVDGKKLHGWEFRLFKANVGVLRGGNKASGETEVNDEGIPGGSIFKGYDKIVTDTPLLMEETYQCCMTIYRGGDREGCVFKWSEKTKDLEKFLRFVTIDAMVNAAKHLSADGNGRGREIITEKELKEREADRHRLHHSSSREYQQAPGASAGHHHSTRAAPVVPRTSVGA